MGTKGSKVEEKIRELAEKELMKGIPDWLKKLQAKVKTSYKSCQGVRDVIQVVDYEVLQTMAQDVGWSFGWSDSDVLAELMGDKKYIIRELYLEIRLSDPLLKHFYLKTGGWDFREKMEFDPTSRGLETCFNILRAEQLRQKMQKDLATVMIEEEMLARASDLFTGKHEVVLPETTNDLAAFDERLKQARVKRGLTELFEAFYPPSNKG